jgi:type II secretory pathway pseudopilin PulG
MKKNQRRSKMHGFKSRMVIAVVIVIALLVITLPGILLAATSQEIRDNAINTGITEAQSGKALGTASYQQSPPIVLGYIGYGASKDSISKSSQDIRSYAIQNGGTEVQASKALAK